MREVTWVFLHGWGSHSAIWNQFLQHFKYPYQCIDLPGFGPNLPAYPSSVDVYLEQLETALPDQCVLVGWSLGGMLATQLASRAPEKVCALVTMACNPSFIQRQNWDCAMPPEVLQAFAQQFDSSPLKTLKRFISLQCQGDAKRKWVQETLRLNAPEWSGREGQWMSGLGWLSSMDNRPVLRRLGCPQLHIFGDGDALVPALVAQQKVFKCAKAKVVTMTDTGHVPHVSKPLQTFETVRNWAEQALFGIPKNRIAHSFSSAASQYDRFAHVQKQVAQKLIGELPPIAPAQACLDLGCGTGFVTQHLRDAKAFTVGLDIAFGMLTQARMKLPQSHFCQGDAEALPFASASFSLVVSSLALQWCSSLVPTMREVKRILKPGGLCYFSTLGPATLNELRQAWSAVDEYEHVNRFLPKDQVLADVQAAGLRIRNFHTVEIKPEYVELMTLLRELKAIGAHNMNPGRPKGLTLRSRFKQLENAYSKLKSEQGTLPATYEVFMVSAQAGVK